jgi:chemotaxis regulatin CheY-phosphate phosphatase CheZ
LWFNKKFPPKSKLANDVSTLKVVWSSFITRRIRKNFYHSGNSAQTWRRVFNKARRTRAHLSRILVICDKLDRQNFLMCGQHLRHFRHSWHVNQISNMFDIFRHSWHK